MDILSRDALTERLKSARISKRLIRDLRYVPEEITDAEHRDFLVVTTKAGTEGVMLYADRLASFELQRRRPNVSGRVEAVICDICATWQRGTNSATLTFRTSPTHSVSYLVCADLDCSLHVRGRTPESTLSRVQLREHITPGERVRRLNERLDSMMTSLVSV